MIHYWAVIYYTWLYICTGVRALIRGVILHFEYIVSFPGWDSGVLKWECFCLVIAVFSRGMSIDQ